jgi:hypothetical protein
MGIERLDTGKHFERRIRRRTAGDEIVVQPVEELEDLA